MNDKDKRLISRIQKHCEYILSFTDGMTYDVFVKDDRTNQACIHNIEQIGENANKLSHDFKQDYDNQPWDDMYRFRIIIAHNYGAINFKIVWKTVIEDIPKLYKFTERLLKSNN
jgi:uncharacterized protein with HEPN domain